MVPSPPYPAGASGGPPLPSGPPHHGRLPPHPPRQASPPPATAGTPICTIQPTRSHPVSRAADHPTEFACPPSRFPADPDRRALSPGRLIVVAIVVVLVISGGSGSSADSGSVTTADTQASSGTAQASSDTVETPPPGVAADQTYIELSTSDDGPVVDVYLDFLCPHCATFHDVNGADLQELAEAGGDHPASPSASDAGRSVDPPDRVLRPCRERGVERIRPGSRGLVGCRVGAVREPAGC